MNCKYDRPGSARVSVGPDEGDMELQRAVDKLQRVAWIQSLAPWEVMATFTFAWEASLDSAVRCYERFVCRKVGRISYFMAVEGNPSRCGYHVHALWADCASLYRKEVHADWFSRYGRALIEPVRHVRDAESYASKYLTKPNGWWNVHLQWHRLRAISGESFALAVCPRPAPGVVASFPVAAPGQGAV